MTRKKEHPADGLYYLNLDLLERNRACGRHRARWQNFFGRKRVPITLDVVRKMHRRYERCVGWGAALMRKNGKITGDEAAAFDIAYFASDWDRRGATEDECRAFMDLLAARARREGRLA